MRLSRRLVSIALSLLLVALFMPHPAHAYIDPATTSYIIQIVAAFFITLGVVFSAFSARARLFFTKIKMRIMEEFYRSRAVEKGVELPQSKDPRTSWSPRMKLLVSIGLAVAITFTFAVFGALDIFTSNKGNFPFLFGEIWGTMLLVGAVAAIITFVILIALRGNVFDIAVTLGVGILLAGYVQGNFLNSNLGLLTGDAIAWHGMTRQVLINTAVWSVLVIIPFAIWRFNKVIWRGLCLVLPFLLIILQTTALVASLTHFEEADKVRDRYYLSTQGMFDVSKKENIIVIILDRLDEKFIRAIEEEDPSYFSDLDGFTRYTNNTNSYARTFPSVINMLTGAVHRFDQPTGAFSEKSYAKGSMLNDLRSAQYGTKLYMSEHYAFARITDLLPVADNVLSGDVKVSKATAAKRLLRLSAFRYAPLTFKPFFWMASDFSGTTSVAQDNGPAPYQTDDFAFYQELKENGLSVQNDKNNFVYYHLNGSHDPLTINAKVERVPENKTNTIEQTKGCFNIVRELIRQLKDKGLYENATIIITGDHGQHFDHPDLDHVIVTGLFVKPKGSFGKPLAVSSAPVSADNLRGTIIKAAGIKSDKYAPAYWEVPENADITRKYFYQVNPQPGYENGYLDEYDIKGDANDLANWHKVQRIKIAYPH